jgi:hypothetical protein
MKIKVNAARVRKLIVMLESGELNQTTSQLRRTSLISGTSELVYSHCCLGVGCELYSAEVAGFFDDDDSFIANFTDESLYDIWTEEDEEHLDLDDDKDFKFAPEKDSSYMPPPVEAWFGFNRHIQEILARMNDNEKTFKEIAQYLRDRLYEQRRLGYGIWEDPEE